MLHAAIIYDLVFRIECTVVVDNKVGTFYREMKAP